MQKDLHNKKITPTFALLLERNTLESGRFASSAGRAQHF